MEELVLQKINKYVYDHTKVLGKGQFGTVHKAMIFDNLEEFYAMKKILIKKLTDDPFIYDLVLREIEILRKLEGEHIVRLIDVFRTKNNLYLFMDFCDGGDLEAYLKEQGRLSEEEACSITKQIAKAFVTLEKLGITDDSGKKVVIMHRDIKPANILLHQGKIKLADFGFARMIDEVDKNRQASYTLLGTPLYCSPEVLACDDYGPKCDVWSAGVVFYKLLFGGTPWTAETPMDLYKNMQSIPLLFPRALKPETKQLMQSMLKFKESERISWKEVYEHPALKDISI